MKDRMFKGLSVEKCWLPLTATLLEGHNISMILSGNDDAKYCHMMSGLMDVIRVPYERAISNDILDRLLVVFIYVMEFVYGNPYGTENHVSKKYISVSDYFDNIRKHWNDDITKELNKIDNKL